MEVVVAPNLKLLTKAHENKWVAFSADRKRIVAVADTLQALRHKVALKSAVVMRVLPADLGYAPASRP